MSNEQGNAASSFTVLSAARRRDFVRLNYGFLADVADGSGVSRATVVRTWYGEFRKPNPAIVAALDAAYRLIVDRDRKRRARLGIKNPADRAA